MKDNPNRAHDRNKFLAIAIAIAIITFFIYMTTFRMDMGPTPEPDMGAPSEKQSSLTPEAPPKLASRTAEIIIPDEQRQKLEALTTKEYKAPAWISNAVPVAVDPGKDKIVIIIDDLGENRINSRAILNLPGPLTLAFLPYPDKVAELAAAGRAAGHEIMVHMPMEAMDPEADSRPYVLRSGIDRAAFEAVFLSNLAAFDGYVGINNHMGSHLTQDREAMKVIMNYLGERGLLFVDSRTIHTSIAAQAAHEHGIPYAERDVFIDHKPTKNGVEAALAEIERVAHEKGLAIAIGHPKTVTIEALRAWLPTLMEKNLQLVPVSAVVMTDTAIMMRDAAAAVPIQSPSQPPL